jgi:hypothetical protein
MYLELHVHGQPYTLSRTTTEGTESRNIWSPPSFSSLNFARAHNELESSCAFGTSTLVNSEPMRPGNRSSFAMNALMSRSRCLAFGR